MAKIEMTKYIMGRFAKATKIPQSPCMTLGNFNIELWEIKRMDIKPTLKVWMSLKIGALGFRLMTPNLVVSNNNRNLIP